MRNSANTTLRTLICLTLTLALLAGCGTGGRAPADAAQPPGETASQQDAPDTAQTPQTAEPQTPEPEAEAPPRWEWETAPPQEQGMDAERLAAMHQALAGDSAILSVLTVRGGVIVDEYYGEGYGPDSVFHLYSCSKSFTGAIIGIAIDRGLIPGVEVTLADYFPQVAGTAKDSITLEQLLTHTSGIQWYEWNGAAQSFWGMNTADNWVDYVLEQPMAATPGATFAYTTGGPHLMAAMLQLASGQTELDFAREHLFGPLGMDSVRWDADPQGINDGGNGIWMTARDAACFGLLYLNGGVWQGEQIVSPAWVEASTQAQTAGPGGRSGAYGYQWWIRSFGDPAYDTYYAMGHAGQFILVVPELELITVITSDSEVDTYAPWPYFTDYILAACNAA